MDYDKAYLIVSIYQFEAFRFRATLCRFQFFQKYHLRMRTTKIEKIYVEIPNHCLHND